MREPRELREENRKIKQLVADLSLDRKDLQDSFQKNGEADAVELGDVIEAFYRKSLNNYGRPRIQADLRGEGSS